MQVIVHEKHAGHTQRVSLAGHAGNTGYGVMKVLQVMHVIEK